MTKLCTKCREIKAVDQFNKCGGGLQSWCKLCKAQLYSAKAEEISTKRKVAYREKHPLPIVPKDYKKCVQCGQIKVANNEFFGRSSSRKDGLRSACKECRKKEYLATQELRVRQSRKHYRANREQHLATTREYKAKNADWYREYHMDYYKANADRIKATSKKNAYLRISQDPAFKLLARYRTQIYKSLKRLSKSAATTELLGCTIEYLRHHLESQFIPGMTWGNYGKWHVDHIRPCALFDFSQEEQQKECFHYTNLQPLWAKDNMRKSAKYVIAQ